MHLPETHPPGTPSATQNLQSRSSTVKVLGPFRSGKAGAPAGSSALDRGLPHERSGDASTAPTLTDATALSLLLEASLAGPAWEACRRTRPNVPIGRPADRKQ
jgi:hypothetical protein